MRDSGQDGDDSNGSSDRQSASGYALKTESVEPLSKPYTGVREGG